MSGVTSCRQCGCSEIDTDPSRGDAVCTNCGFVLEESIIVSEVTFEEDGHGGASAVGQFVSADSRGGGGMGCSGAGGFHSGVGKESREITLRAAKKRITDVAQQLRLNQHCVDVAFNFFKMALHKQLTKGRRHALTIAACVYITCRVEGTPHLLIDFSDVVQTDVFALGRAYTQISRSLFINVPAVDPCMYILRFAHKFKLGNKTHEVAMTALRLVQRMKRDWIHLGRRPSGLCGAALLIAARTHGFSRTIQQIIDVVKVHETTLRKRLIEFGETPSSSLTLEEFMSVDLEEEHDPPSYKAARLKDREQLQKLLDGGMRAELTEIQVQIEEELDRRREKVKARLCELAWDDEDSMSSGEGEADGTGELDLTDIDDAEIDSYLMNNTEAERKRILWEKINSDYIVTQARKEEQRKQDEKDGKLDKKKRIKKEKQVLRKDRFMVKNANEAIKIMLDKKMSCKINYDVLKRLTEQAAGASGSLAITEGEAEPEDTKDKDLTTIVTVIESGPIIPKRNWRSIKEEPSPSKKKIKTELIGQDGHVLGDSKSIILKPKKEKLVPKVEPVIQKIEPEVVVETGPIVPVNVDHDLDPDQDDEDDHYIDTDEEDVGPSARELLTQFRGEEEAADDDYYE